ncbi:MAG TPA: ATP-binding protein [Myxococcaceae bacterium]|nr:ATP-binding protein [Myxococcaceae bacterium]
MASGSPSSTPLRPLARAHRHYSRQILVGLGLLFAIAMVAPLFSYRSDVEESRLQVRANLSREAAFYAETFRRQLDILEAELSRIAQRPEVDLGDANLQPERTLLEAAHHDSALFDRGIAILDGTGHALWSEPASLLPPGADLSHSLWYQRLLAENKPVLEAFPSRPGELVVCVPILRGGAFAGALLGVVEPLGQLLPNTLPKDEHLVVADRERHVLFEGPTRSPVSAADLAELLSQATLWSAAEEQQLQLRQAVLLVRPLERTTMSLALLVDEGPRLARARQRLLQQLAFLALIQAATIALFAAYLRRTTRGFLAVEERASQQETMAALGTAASLIAHEVKNALNGLTVAAGLLEGQGDGAAARSARSQVDRLRHLAGSLLSFGRPAAPQLMRVELDRTAREVVEALGILPEAGEAKVELELESPLWVTADPLLLQTAIDNLVRNAVEAAVTAKDLGKVESPWVRVRASREGDSGARVVVEDNAGGPPPEVEARLFEPFATGKPKGIGLGLAMAQRAVQAQGGALTFRRTGEGSAFEIRLPLAG